MLCIGGRAAAAQVAPNRATASLFPTNVTDARALWVNPAGLAVAQTVSLELALTMGDPGSQGQLRQWTAGFNSRGVSFGYQHDVLPNGVKGDTYRAGLAAGRAGIAGGLAASLYRGETKTLGWDLGAVIGGERPLELGAALTNLGNPVVRGVRQPATALPGLTWRPGRGSWAFSLLGRLATDSVLGYAAGVTLQMRAIDRLRLLFRLDTDRSLRRSGLAVGVSIGAHDVASAVGSATGSPVRWSDADLYAVSSRGAGTH